MGVCFILHGYGQLAHYFIKPFTDQRLGKTLFVAPEGLHRFYLDGTKGRVGASWMTREDRLRDIEDYCAYLDQLWEHVIPRVNPEARKQVGILGFSQGVATACRWLSFSEHNFAYLINYAGIYPPDLPVERAVSRMKKLPVKHLLGDEDEYISLERMRSALQGFAQQGFPDKLKIFKGGHKVYPEILLDVFSEMEVLS